MLIHNTDHSHVKMHGRVRQARDLGNEMEFLISLSLHLPVKLYNVFKVSTPEFCALGAGQPLTGVIDESLLWY